MFTGTAKQDETFEIKKLWVDSL